MFGASYQVARETETGAALETNRSIMEIAGEVGMAHSHFGRVFVRRLGVTPTEFRQINRQ
jgi:AraC-like DNA-binding protein